jgi:hypothetical protein
MLFDFEALVGHLYVVRGRAVSNPPPGALVEVAPRKAARGRETDTFFVLVLASGETTATPEFYEQMAAFAADRYFNSTGSVSAGLRDVFGQINDNLYEHNQTKPTRYEASLIAAVLRGSDLVVARVGAAAALLRHESIPQPFPTDFSNDEALYAPPLGVQAAPDVRMSMFKAAAGTRLLLGDAALADLEYDRLTTALAKGDIGESLVTIKDMVVGSLAAMLVEFVPPDAPSPLPLREADTNKVAGAAPVVQASSEAPTAPPGPRLSDARGAAMRNVVGTAALGAARVMDSVSHTIERATPEDEQGQRRSLLSNRGAAAIAVLVPIAVVVLVILFWVGGTGQSEFDRCFANAEAAAVLARGMPAADLQGTLAAWQAVQAVADGCEQLRSGDAQLALLVGEAQNVIDALLIIERRPTTILDALPSATLTDAVLQTDDLYVLDNANDQVYRMTLTPDGKAIVSGSRQPIQAMRRGGIVDQFTMGNLIDIAWADDGAGLKQDSVITALDANGVLVDCPPRFLQNCAAQQLNTSTWVDPISMTYWQGRLYVLDPAANQVWRYDPSSGVFPNAPLEYFVGSARPDISQAVDFAIDTPGALYILFSDGAMIKFNGGERVPFAYSNFPEAQPMTATNSLFLNTSPTDLMLYITSRDARTIYQTTHAGTFAASFQPENDDLLAALNDAVADANRDMIYALSGNSVLALERGQ